MPERTHPFVPVEFIQKILAFDRYCGDSGKVALTAYFLYLDRQKLGIPGSAGEDWGKAEEMVARQLTKELSSQLA
jgi:hypothetical protein